MQNSLLFAAVSVLSLAFAPTNAAAQPEAGYTPKATIVVSPAAPSPGDDVTVTVTGCTPAPGEVDVRIDGVLVGQAQVGPDGSFVQDFTVPLEAQGPVPVEVDCDSEVLASIIDVRVGTLPFQPQDLPRTGSDAQPLLQVAAALVAIGVLFIALGRRRETATQPQPRHAATPHDRQLVDVGR